MPSRTRSNANLAKQRSRNEPTAPSSPVEPAAPDLQAITPRIRQLLLCQRRELLLGLVLLVLLVILGKLGRAPSDAHIQDQRDTEDTARYHSTRRTRICSVYRDHSYSHHPSMSSDPPPTLFDILGIDINSSPFAGLYGGPNQPVGPVPRSAEYRKLLTTHYERATRHIYAELSEGKGRVGREGAVEELEAELVRLSTAFNILYDYKDAAEYADTFVVRKGRGKKDEIWASVEWKRLKHLCPGV